MPSIRVRPVQLTILVTVLCFSPVPLQHRLMSQTAAVQDGGAV